MPWTLGDPTFRGDEFDRQRRSSPWAGHRWFAYDLVGWLRPDRLVELGTHFGCSFFVFSQAVADHDLDTELIAVDTWAGDPHAGFYDDDVFEQVRSNLAQYYPDVRTRLLRKLFDDARDDVEDASVDLLHIDGFHTYDAVAHDLAAWEPKLADEGTVLFHDVSPSSGYGSAMFWQELADKRGGLMFWHNFGLGVWTRHHALASLLASEEFAQLARYYPAQARADLLEMSVEDLTAMVDAKQQLVEHQDFLIADRDEALAAQTALIDAKQEIIDHQDVLVVERDDVISTLRDQLEIGPLAGDADTKPLGILRPLLRRR